jgi:hypothetical protein
MYVGIAIFLLNVNAYFVTHMQVSHMIPKAQCVLNDHVWVLQIFPYIISLQNIM